MEGQVIVTVGGQTLVADARQFKTGSRGFYGSGKVTLTNGKRYQVSVNVVEIGSKPTNGAIPAPEISGNLVDLVLEASNGQ